MKMQELVDAFVAHAKEEDLCIMYCQIRKDGEVAGGWSRFSVLSRLESFSLSKTFCAAGIGIAIDEGLIRLDEKVASAFPELTYDVNDPNALDITVEHMLTMSSGLEGPLFFRDHPERATVRDWGRHFYEKGKFVRKPGEQFLYSNFNTYMLGCLVEKKCGKNLHEYMRFRLFEPLGIGNPDMTICPYGHTVAANGLAINVEELYRFGQMLQRKGVYNGKRIVPQAYVEKMVSSRIASNKQSPLGDCRFGYGYQTWIDPARKAFFLWGIFGQYCVVFPEKNVIVTVQGREERDAMVAKRLWADILANI